MAVGSKSLHCILLFYCAAFTLIALAMLVNTSMTLADLMAHKAFVDGDTGKAGPLSLRTKASGHLANAENHHGTVNLLGAPSLLVAAAVLSVAVGAFGFYATLQRNANLLRVLVLLMIIVVVMELSGGIWAITVRSSSSMSIRASLIHNMEDYGVGITLEGETKTFGKKTSPVKTQTHPWDILQKKLECCGVDGPGDYMSRGSMPFSCCSAAKGVEKGTKKRTAVVATTTATPVFSCVSISQKGCLEALDGYARGRLALVGSLGIAAAFIYAVGAMLAAVLTFNIKKDLHKMYH